MSVSAFCRRRLAVVVHKLKMAESVKEAVMFIEQGHVKVGVDTITDPAFHVNRGQEDFITWTKSSSNRKKIKEYTGERDDFNDLTI